MRMLDVTMHSVVDKSREYVQSRRVITKLDLVRMTEAIVVSLQFTKGALRTTESPKVRLISRQLVKSSE